ncbi:hypothetical protein NJB1507_40860 [Mycobacterium marinum]|uniref:hypothetical protein n=1 Tax=Mycobacterium marinum TaxID=1781 RepID=UPI0021C3C650|nr:hypothetical protein [Mycobacterium marinum]GJO31556.1 hypothetical protein NJB1507_40860 [Mycobacterium marinum]
MTSDTGLALAYIKSSPTGVERIRIIEEVGNGGTDRLAGKLLRGVLDINATAARRVRTDQGLLAVYGAISEMAETGCLAEKIAAQMIIGHGQLADIPGVDVDLRNVGATTFNDAINRMDALNYYEEVLAAIAAIWRRLLPELHTRSGLRMLDHLAHELAAEN